MIGSTIPTADQCFSQGVQLVNCGKLQEAEENFTRCIKLLTESADSIYNDTDHWREKLALAHNNRGHIRYQLVEFTEAVEDYSQALQYNNQLVPALYNRGTIHYRLSRFRDAADDMQQALQIDPTFHDASIALQKCLNGLRTTS